MGAGSVSLAAVGRKIQPEAAGGPVGAPVRRDKACYRAEAHYSPCVSRRDPAAFPHARGVSSPSPCLPLARRLPVGPALGQRCPPPPRRAPQRLPARKTSPARPLPPTRSGRTRRLDALRGLVRRARLRSGPSRPGHRRRLSRLPRRRPAIAPARSAAGSPRWARSTGSTTCPGTPRVATSRGRCQACFAARPATHRKPPRSRWPCCASWWRHETIPPTAGATGGCCCLASPARCAAPSLVALRVEDVAESRAGSGSAFPHKVDPAGQAAESACPRGTCRGLPGAGVCGWQAITRRRPARCSPHQNRRKIGNAACARTPCEEFPPAAAGWRGFPPGDSTALGARAACRLHHRGLWQGRGDEDIMRHTRHRDLPPCGGSVQRAGLVSGNQAGRSTCDHAIRFRAFARIRSGTGLPHAMG